MSDHENEPLSIADKLARLDLLETDFQRVLEAAKLDAMGEFAAGAGHEINNPLTVISGRAQLLLRDETDPERRHSLALIVAQANRVYEMIADMMLFARPPTPELQSVDLVKLVDDVVADFQVRCADRAIAIRRDGDSTPVVVEADPVQLGVAIRAVCQNAVEALSDVAEGRIDIAVEREPGPRIRIGDNGPGIAADERSHLFDPFYSARQAGRGLGLGLSKAWRIMANHGGRIDVLCPPGQGATFVLVLQSRTVPV